MVRTFEIYELKCDFVVVLFQDLRPITTLTGPKRTELETIAGQWAAFCSNCRDRYISVTQPYPAALTHMPWTGLERRKALR